MILAILNSLSIENGDITQDFKEKLQKVIDKFTIKIKNDNEDDIIGFCCVDYKKRFQGKRSKFLWYIFIKNKITEKWTGDKKKIPKIAIEMLKTFGKIKAKDCNKYLIGFLTHNKPKTSIIFKLKTNMKGTGQACPTSGENRKDIISRINRLLRELGDETDKYKMKEKTKRQDDSVYNTPTTLNKYPIDVAWKRNFVDLKKSELNEKTIPMTDQQLCIETEFILRYLDENKATYGKKRWFFSTIEDILNSIKDIEKK